MELQRGICTLCLESSKVLTSSNAAEFCKCLPQIFYDSFLTEAKFEEIKSSLKICSLCCYKVQTANEVRKDLQNVGETENFKSTQNACCFCETDKCLLEATSNWKYFTERTEGFLKIQHFPVSVCPRCLFYFDVIFNIKTKLLYKFPQLSGSTKKKQDDSSPKPSDTPKRKSLSTSPPNSKKRKIFNNCFTYLQPLRNNNYQVTNKLKLDKKLYKKIPYVKLRNVDLNNLRIDFKKTSKVRPAFKIKLKPKLTIAKVIEKEKVVTPSIATGKTDLEADDGFQSTAYIKLSRATEIANKLEKDSTKSLSSTDDQPTAVAESEEQQQDETPKTASAVRKRSFSLYVAEADTQEEDQQGSAAVGDTENVEGVVAKCIPDSSSDEHQKEDLVEKNGLEPNEVSNDQQVSQTENTNGDKQGEESDTSEVTDESKDGTSLKSNHGSDESDSDSSKKKNLDTLESDSLNGSERKKKRVTFSDDTYNEMLENI